MSNEKTTNGVIKAYIGIPEKDSSDEFLYVDMVVPGREVNLYTSPQKLNDCAADDFMEYLEAALNEAFLWARHLGIKVQIDSESLLSIAEDYSERTLKGIHALMKEVKS